MKVETECKELPIYRDRLIPVSFKLSKSIKDIAHDSKIIKWDIRVFYGLTKNVYISHPKFWSETLVENMDIEITISGGKTW